MSLTRRWMPWRHSSLERGMWRCWFQNGQSLEVTWAHRTRRGWRLAPIALGVGIHSDDCDNGDRHLHVGLGLVQAFIPLGIVPGPYVVGDEPGWGFSSCREHTWLRWGDWSKFVEWPLHRVVLSWDYELEDGNWADVRTRPWEQNAPNVEWCRRPSAKSERHQYTYTLRSGQVQRRTATIHRERWVRGRQLLHRLGWRWTEYKIDVEFDDEVGERSGSWKGGTVGCSYVMRPGETPLDALRRMEREREFR